MPRPLHCLLGAVLLMGCTEDGPASGLPIGPILSRFDTTGPTMSMRTVTLADHPRPAAAAFRSRTVRRLPGGRIERLEVTPVAAGVTVIAPDGCRVTRPRDWFSPAAAWEKCGTSHHWHTARAEVRVLDPLYPLRLGASGRYERRAVSHTGRTSTRTTLCRVEDTAAVDLGQRDLATFVVVCDDGRIRRTTWYAPQDGPVAYREEHRSRGLREAWVLSE